MAEGSSPDPRLVGRVVAGVVLAGGAATPEAMAQANEGLARLGRAPLHPDDFVVATPEELAPRIPGDLRPAVAELLLSLAGGILGIGLAYVGVPLLVARNLSPLPGPQVAVKLLAQLRHLLADALQLRVGLFIARELAQLFNILFQALDFAQLALA